VLEASWILTSQKAYVEKAKPAVVSQAQAPAKKKPAAKKRK
jgi:hypothetical protein